MSSNKNDGIESLFEAGMIGVGMWKDAGSVGQPDWVKIQAEFYLIELL